MRAGECDRAFLNPLGSRIRPRVDENFLHACNSARAIADAAPLQKKVQRIMWKLGRLFAVG